MRDVYAGIDIGGTNTVIGLFDDNVKLIAKGVIPSPKPPSNSSQVDPSPFLDRLANEVQTLVKYHTEGMHLRGAGIGAPGKVDSVQGIVNDASNLGWREVHLASEMSERLNVPVVIEHDVRSYALGEALAGAGVGYRDIICLTVGTGIAAGIIVNGMLIRGSDYCAGEIGHDAVDGEHSLCACGKFGCLETVASATGIARLAEIAIQSGMVTSLAQLQGHVTAYDVYQACLDGDAAARDIFEYVGTVLGRKLASVVYLLNPEVVIIGGGVAAAGDILLDPLRRELWKQYPDQQAYLKVRTGELGDNAGIIGAVNTVLSRTL
jgi:glucokinase